MRRNPALATIILCIAPLALAAQTSEGISHDRRQLEPSLQHNASRQNIDHPSAPGVNGSDQQNVRSHENERLQEPESPSQRIGFERPVPELLTEVAQRPAMGFRDFEDLALANNPALRQASELVQRSAGQARQAGLYPNPSAGYLGEEIRGGSFGGGENGAFIQQSIVLGGKLGLRRRVFEEQRREDELGVAEQRYRLFSDVAQGFYSALAAQEIVNLRRNLLKIAQDAVETAHQLANVGQADAPDVLQTEVEAEQAKVEYATAQRNYIQTFNTLAAVAGKPDLPMSPVEGSLEDWPRLDSEQVIETISRDSPSVKRARQAVEQAEAKLRSARREAVPDLVLRAGLQQDNEPLNEAAINPRAVGLVGFATVGVNLPIFNRNQGNVGAAKAELHRAQEGVSRVQLSLRRTAQPLLQAYLAEQVEAERYKSEMIPRAARAYQLYLNKYRQMASAYPQVIISQRTLFQLRVSYIQALENLWKSAIALQNFTLSGGLDAPTPSGDSSTTINLPNSSGSGLD
jgi:cobalt-zinc-cadmium efflux system outer membrane protein